MKKAAAKAFDSSKHPFQLELAVRDYECDLQGIVNHAVYLHYLEHTRHEFLKWLGLNFGEMHARGQDAVVTTAEVRYLYPLRSGDRFTVELTLEPGGRVRFVFNQRITRLPDAKPILEARITAALLEHGRPVVPAAILQALQTKARTP
jgi:acyl-CoA thioester hydrolase